MAIRRRLRGVDNLGRREGLSFDWTLLGMDPGEGSDPVFGGRLVRRAMFLSWLFS
jgi:hypothetical protein